MRREGDNNYASIEEITELLGKIVKTEDIVRDGVIIKIQEDPKEKEEWARHIETLEDMLIELYEKYPNGILSYEREYEHLYNKK